MYHMTAKNALLARALDSDKKFNGGVGGVGGGVLTTRFATSAGDPHTPRISYFGTADILSISRPRVVNPAMGPRYPHRPRAHFYFMWLVQTPSGLKGELKVASEVSEIVRGFISSIRMSISCSQCLPIATARVRPSIFSSSGLPRGSVSDS
jgi:hypothetical protein